MSDSRIFDESHDDSPSAQKINLAAHFDNHLGDEKGWPEISSQASVGNSSRMCRLPRRSPSSSTSYTGKSPLGVDEVHLEHQRMTSEVPTGSQSCAETATTELILLRGFESDEESFEDSEHKHVLPPQLQLKEVGLTSFMSNDAQGRKSAGVNEGDRWEAMSVSVESLPVRPKDPVSASERLMVSAQDLGLFSLEDSIDINFLEKALDEYKRKQRENGPKAGEIFDTDEELSAKKRLRSVSPPRLPNKTTSNSSKTEPKPSSTSDSKTPILISSMLSPGQKSKMNEMLGRPTHSSIPAVYSRVHESEGERKTKTDEPNSSGCVQAERTRRNSSTRRNNAGTRSSERAKSRKGEKLTSSRSETSSSKRRGRSSKPRDRRRGNDSDKQRPVGERSKSRKPRSKEEHKSRESKHTMRDRSRSTSTAQSGSTRTKRGLVDQLRRDRDRSRSTSTARFASKRKKRSLHKSSENERDRSTSTSTSRSRSRREGKRTLHDSRPSSTSTSRSRSRREGKRTLHDSDTSSLENSVEKRTERGKSVSERSGRRSIDRIRSTDANGRSSSSMRNRSISPTRLHQSPLRLSQYQEDSFKKRLNESYDSVEGSLSLLFREHGISQDANVASAAIGGNVNRAASQVEVDKALSEIGVTTEQRLILQNLGLEVRKNTQRRD